MSVPSKIVSVKQKIINATHNVNADRPAWELAQFLLLHYDEIGALNMRRLADTCHSSFSTVRRFCRALGYDNFTDLQRACLENPESQSAIALDNYRGGLYEPRRLYDEITRALWDLGRKTDRTELDRLAEAIAVAGSVVVFALRPYYFNLQEVQSQFFALNKPFYIFDDTWSASDLLPRLETPRCFITVSMAGLVFPALDAELSGFEGIKAALYCPGALRREGGEISLEQYDLKFPLDFRRDDYNYLEIYGKYAVSCFFDMLLGVCIARTQ